jgi:hypothetical protein
MVCKELWTHPFLIKFGVVTRHVHTLTYESNTQTHIHTHTHAHTHTHTHTHTRTHTHAHTHIQKRTPPPASGIARSSAAYPRGSLMGGARVGHHRGPSFCLDSGQLIVWSKPAHADRSSSYSAGSTDFEFRCWSLRKNIVCRWSRFVMTEDSLPVCMR